MILCAASHVSKMYGSNWVFQDLCFEVQDGQRIGIVGRNGCGKTTILKLIAGREQPDVGEIHVKQGLKVGYLEQLPNVHEAWTTRDVLKQAFAHLIDTEQKMKRLEADMATADQEKLQKVFDKYAKLQEAFEREGGYEMESRIDEVANGLGISPTMLATPFAKLSGGEQTKASLGTMLLRRPDVMLLDEPTNHLDLAAVIWLEHFLSTYPGAAVVVSHDRRFLDESVNVVLDLDDGELVKYVGNYTSYQAQKEERLLAEFAAYKEQQKKIARMKEAIKRLRDWANRANPPSDALHRRANSMQKALDKIVRMKRPVLEARRIGLSFQAGDRSGQDVLRLERIAKSYDDATLFADVDLLVRHRDRVAILGVNGAGKSTLLKIALGETEPNKGTVQLGSSVSIGHLSQLGLTHVNEDASVLDVFRDAVPVHEGDARHLLARFLFYGPAVFRKVRDLSGGERMRLRLAQIMHQPVNLLVLDEPTNHLDIESREVLEEALRDFEGTIVAISHDRYFVNQVFNRVCWLENASLRCYEGNYDEAMRQKRRDDGL